MLPLSAGILSLTASTDLEDSLGKLVVPQHEVKVLAGGLQIVEVFNAKRLRSLDHQLHWDPLHDRQRHHARFFVVDSLYNRWKKVGTTLSVTGTCCSEIYNTVLTERWNNITPNVTHDHSQQTDIIQAKF